ncbi:MAG: hypothetical protein ACI4A7_01085, partial [Prevotella sp.]
RGKGHAAAGKRTVHRQDGWQDGQDGEMRITVRFDFNSQRGMYGVTYISEGKVIEDRKVCIE